MLIARHLIEQAPNIVAYPIGREFGAKKDARRESGHADRRRRDES
jgi:hypothetical protein